MLGMLDQMFAAVVLICQTFTNNIPVADIVAEKELQRVIAVLSLVYGRH
jgi:hypothetical protein